MWQRSTVLSGSTISHHSRRASPGAFERFLLDAARLTDQSGAWIMALADRYRQSILPRASKAAA
jgi:hypothetical protein